MTELKAMGLVIGTAGKLFKAIIKGTYSDSSYKIVAYIDLPIKPVSTKKKKPLDKNNTNNNTAPTPPTPNPNKKKKKRPLELMLPRVVEIQVG